MYSLLTPDVARAQTDERRRQAAALRRARAHTPGVRWFRKPASERASQPAGDGPALSSGPCATCG
jgi:hypothetical protein